MSKSLKKINLHDVNVQIYCGNEKYVVNQASYRYP